MIFPIDISPRFGHSSLVQARGGLNTNHAERKFRFSLAVLGSFVQAETPIRVGAPPGAGIVPDVEQSAPGFLLPLNRVATGNRFGRPAGEMPESGFDCRLHKAAPCLLLAKCGTLRLGSDISPPQAEVNRRGRDGKSEATDRRALKFCARDPENTWGLFARSLPPNVDSSERQI